MASLEHMNILCCPEVLPQPTPEVRAIILERRLTMCPDFSGDKDMATRGAKNHKGLYGESSSEI